MFKELIEKRNKLLDEMDVILNKAKTETRAMTDKENTDYSAKKKEIEGIDETIKAEEEMRSLEKMKTKPKDENLTSKQLEERAFCNLIRGVVTEERADMSKAANEAVIPTSIVKKIIKKVEEISPLYSLATKYNVKGNITIPYYDEATDKITVEYADEFTDPASHSGKFLSIELKGYLARAFSKISKSLVNNSDFDIVSFIVNDMAEGFAKWIENELINGTTNKIDGLKGVKLNVDAPSATEITADDLIDVQEEIVDRYQGGAIWIMSRNTRKYIRKLKDSDGNYILNKDATAKWGYTLFGKDVYTSVNMPDMEDSAVPIYYGDFKGLAVKISEEINIEVLREKYVEQHAIGVVGFTEMDSKVENAQMIAKLTMATV